MSALGSSVAYARSSGGPAALMDWLREAVSAKAPLEALEVIREMLKLGAGMAAPGAVTEMGESDR